jgi:hypothetical protein
MGFSARFPAATSLALGLLFGCAPPRYAQIHHDECRRHPGENHEGQDRHAIVAPDLGVRWAEWSRYADLRQGITHRIHLEKRRCEYTVRIEARDRVWEREHYLYVNDTSFVTDASARRLAFVAHDAAGEHVIVDGVESPAYASLAFLPRFSPNGAHVGYVARDQEGFVAVVDGKPQQRAWKVHHNVFHMLDDGRAVIAAIRQDGLIDVMVGKDRYSQVEDLCYDGHFTIFGNHVAFVGKRGGTFATFVDGGETGGVAMSCAVHFSPDGDHFGYLAFRNTPAIGTWSAPIGVAINRSFHPMEGYELVRQRQVDGWIVAELHAQAGISLWVLAAPTPAVQPTQDDYDGPVRVHLGHSTGPAFDEVPLDSFVVDRAGRVRYTGVRGGRSVEVTDNVIPSQAVIMVPGGAVKKR